MMLFIPKENKKLFAPPPPKKRLKDTNGRDMSTHKCLSISAARDLDIHWVGIEQIELFGLQSNPFIENYYLIVVVFFWPTFKH